MRGIDVNDKCKEFKVDRNKGFVFNGMWTLRIEDS